MKKVVSIFLVILTVFTLSAPAFAATPQNVKQYKNMLIFGDSIMCADELPSPADFRPAVNSYPYALAKSLGLDSYTSIAFRGARAVDGLYLLGAAPSNYSSYKSKEYLTKAWHNSTYIWNKLVEVAEGRDPVIGTPRDRVAEADLILVQVGNNDTSGYTVNMSGLNVNSLISLKGGLPVKDIANAALMLTDCMTKFKKDFPALIKEIKSINSHADIVLLGSYNPYSQISLFEGTEDIAIGNLLSSSTALVNKVVKDAAKKYDCIYVDIFELGEQFAAQSILKGLGALPLHPTVAGHRWIADRVLEELPATEKKLSRPKNATVRFAFGAEDAGIYELKRDGIFWNIREPGLLPVYVTDGIGTGVAHTVFSDIWCYNGGFYRFGMIRKDTRFGMPYLTFSKIYLAPDGNGGLTGSTAKTEVTLFEVN